MVLGAGGFIGGHLTKRLVREGTRVIALDVKPLAQWWQRPLDAHMSVLDTRDFSFAAADLPEPDEIYNLAADMGGIGFIEGNKAACMLSVLGTTNVLVGVQEQGWKSRVFYSSSACVYPAYKQVSEKPFALREDDAYPAMPEDGYGWEKLFSERMHRHFLEDYGIETRVARYHNIYGPWGTWAGGREKAPAALCRKIAQAKIMKQDTIEVWGDGKQTRSFCYVDDCVTGTIKLMRSDYTRPLNIGSSYLVSIDELIELISEIADWPVRCEYRRDAAQGVRGRNSDNTLIREVLDWEPDTQLFFGLEKTYSWISDQLERTIGG